LRRPYLAVIGIALAILALAQRLGAYENRSLALALAIAAFGLLTYVAFSWASDRRAIAPMFAPGLRQPEGLAPGLHLEEDETPLGLNLIFRSGATPSEVSLTVTDMQKWNTADREFSADRGFGAIQLRGATQPDFSGEALRYQLITWLSEGNPVINGVEDKLWTLPSSGIWRADLEYRSTVGAPIRFPRYVEWDGRAKPFFTHRVDRR